MVHEDIDDEIKDFSKYFFGGDIYLDEDKQFYQALGNTWKSLWSMVFSLRTWSNVMRSRKNKDVSGNLKGEGRLMGGVILMGKEDEGPYFVHREDPVGEFADLEELDAAMKTMLNLTTDEDNDNSKL